MFLVLMDLLNIFCYEISQLCHATLTKSSKGQTMCSRHSQTCVVDDVHVLDAGRDGVMLAADTLASYGSLARYKDVQRIKP